MYSNALNVSISPSISSIKEPSSILDQSVDVKKKRGRRKKLIDLVDPQKIVSTLSHVNTQPVNIQYILDEQIETQLDSMLKTDQPLNKIPTPDEILLTNENLSTESQSICIKKRGRKPKGGKIIVKPSDCNIKPSQISNIILHLKCSLNDLNDYNVHMSQQITNPTMYNPTVPPIIMTYNDEKTFFSLYENTETPSELIHQKYAYNETNKLCVSDTICSLCNIKYNDDDDVEIDDTADINIKDINTKLKKLKISLYKNALPDKKSACFWCTFDYDNPACYIPKYNTEESIFGYGSFCRPECAVAYLMKENIDDSTKFERYHLLNHIYSKIYNYKKNIKPAPNPYYLLDKFYGNLSIQEYRKLLKSEHLLLVIDKPLTRILPELHEDNEEFILNLYGTSKTTTTNTSGIYKVKKQSEKQQGPSKNSIMRNKFGLQQ